MAWFGDEDEPLVRLPPGERMPERFRRRRMRDGSSHGALVEVHPDSRVQEFVEQVREQEIAQAIDRLRLVHRETPAEVFILSNIVLPVTVDRLVNWRGLMPSRLAVAAARLDGVLPLAPAWLAGRFHDLWETPKAAEHELRRAGQNPQTPIGMSIWEFGGFRTALYRVVGGGPRPSRALIRADHPAPEAVLAGWVGPLAMFCWESETPPGETAGQAAEVAHPVPAPSLSPADDFTDPRTWDLPDAADVTVAAVVDAAAGGPATDVIVDSGTPPPFAFRGQDPPVVDIIEVVASCGGKVSIVETGVVPVPAVVPAVLGYGHDVTEAETRAPPSVEGPVEAVPGRVRKVAS